jgi:hypothetical protein
MLAGYEGKSDSQIARELECKRRNHSLENFTAMWFTINPIKSKADGGEVQISKNRLRKTDRGKILC